MTESEFEALYNSIKRVANKYLWFLSAVDKSYCIMSALEDYYMAEKKVTFRAYLNRAFRELYGDNKVTKNILNIDVYDMENNCMTYIWNNNFYRNKNQHKLDSFLQEELRACLKKGESRKYIRERFNICDWTITNYKRKYGVITDRRFSQAEKNEIFEYMKTHSRKETSLKFGISNGTISYYKKKYAGLGK